MRTGLEWLDGATLPAHWQCGGIKRFGTVTLGKMLQSDTKGEQILAPYLRAANVQPGGELKTDDAKSMWFYPDELRALSLNRGDVVAVEGGVGGYGRAAYVRDNRLFGWGFQNSINRIRPIGDNDGRYLTYVLLAVRALGYLANYCNFVSMPHLTAEKLAALTIPLPPVREQRQIADFLDRETAQIDALIIKQERLIGTLRERRNAVVDRAMENSARGSAKKLAWVFTFHNGDRGTSYPSRDEFVSSGIPFINAGHLTGWSIDFSSMNYVTEEKFISMGGAKLRRNDILFCLRGSLGKIGLFEECGTGALASSLVALRRVGDDMDVRYSMYLLGGRRTRDAISLAQAGSAQPNLSVEQLAQFRYSVPALEVQRETVVYLDGWAAKIDATIAKGEGFIGLARERRAALITEAVTGRIDVSTGKAREGV